MEYDVVQLFVVPPHQPRKSFLSRQWKPVSPLIASIACSWHGFSRKFTRATFVQLISVCLVYEAIVRSLSHICYYLKALVSAPFPSDPEHS